MRALEALRGESLEIEDIALRQPNLDEVFLALTGRATNDDAAARDAA
jgi:hypothetical protein